jgi:ATP-binding cassette subfamily F protein 3
MILIRDASLSFQDRILFNKINLILQKNDRIGLFGLNGAGKSTLLKAIAGGVVLDSGTIQVSSHFTVAYMPQEVTLQSDQSILDETLSAFKSLQVAQLKVRELEDKLQKDPDNNALASAYVQAHHELMEQDPEKKRAEALKILSGLGFDTTKTAEPTNSMSVGWKMRIVLAKLLLQNADFYLFDEPTNHLDIVAKEWFLRFLKNSGAGFLLVCHEKRFLNILCKNIFEIVQGNGTLYTGNYDAYIRQRDEKIEKLSAAFILQQKEIQEMKETINRFRASASKAKMAQSMIKKLEKVERIVLPTVPPNPNFSFPLTQKSARLVLSVNEVAQTFGEKKVFEHCSFVIERGQKIAIVAPNGGGKTTLITLIQKKLPLQKGSIVFGENVITAFFDQDQLKSLDPNKSVFENASMVEHNQTSQRVRSLLGSFLFQGDDVKKKVSVLSGGERNRLGMVRVLLRNANFLILDEPTNHLDIPSKDILLNALKTFEGTILFVSHDHDFINELATHILELQPASAHLFHGNYEAYLYQKGLSLPNPPVENQQKTSSSSAKEPTLSDDKEKQKEIKKIEAAIAKTETEIEAIQNKFIDLEYGTLEFENAVKKLTASERELKKLVHQWESLTENGSR